MWNNLYRPSVAMRQLLLKITTKRHKNQFLEQSIKYLSGNASYFLKQSQETMPNDKVSRKLMNELKIVLKEAGGSDLSKNEKVTQTLATVKKQSLPVFFIEKALQQNKLEKSLFAIEVIAPHNILMLIHVQGLNKVIAESMIRSTLRRICNGKIVSDNSVLSEFEPMHIIICQKDCTLDDAVADGIEVDADNVEEIEWNNQKYFEFTVNTRYAMKCYKYLLNADYDIIFSDVVHEPKDPIERTEQVSNVLQTVEEALRGISDVKRIEYNIE